MSKFARFEVCGTPYCGAVDKFFCVRCRHYVYSCLCTPASCACVDRRGWAGPGERKLVTAQLEAQ